jgi:23S rRNA pseudouridine955/2504/2580 synthase
MGHALAGDERYGDEATNRRFRQSGLKRLFLHAAHTTFRHPHTGDAVKVEALLDSELADFLKDLPK